MAKLGKILAGVAALLVLLGAGLLGAVALRLDPDGFKGEISAAVERATGRALSIAGPIRLDLFPWPGLELSDLTLAGPEGTDLAPLARLASARLRVDPWSLWQRRLVVEQVWVEGLRLNLQRGGSGRGNWEGLGGGRPGAAGGAVDRDSAPRALARVLGGLVIGRVALRDAELIWLDPQGEQQLALRGISFESGRIEPERPSDLRLGFELDDPRRGLRGPITLTATLQPSGSLQALRIAPLNARATLSGPRLGSGPLEIEARAEALLDLARQALEVDPVRISAGTLTLTGSAQGSALGSTTPSFDGTFVLGEVNPRAWLERLGLRVPEIADPSLLQRLEARSDWHLTPDRLVLRGLGVRLDETNLQGEASVGPLANPAYRFQLAIDRIDLDRYRPLRTPAHAKVAGGNVAPATAGAPSPLLALGLLGSLDVEGRLSIGALTLHGLRLGQAEIHVRSQNGQVMLVDQIGQFYQGRLEGQLGLAFEGPTPRISLEQQGEGFQVGPLLQDLTGEPQLTGRCRLSVRLATEGDSEAAARRNLSGEVGISLREGSVAGFDLAQTIREAKARLRGESPPKAAGPAQTPLTELDFQAEIREGVLHDDLRARSPQLRLTGTGTLDLATQTLDFRLKPLLIGSPKEAGGREPEELRGIVVPVSVTGSLAEPQWRVDLAALAAEFGKSGLEGRLEQKLEGKKGIKGLGQGLRELFGR